MDSSSTSNANENTSTPCKENEDAINLTPTPVTNTNNTSNQETDLAAMSEEVLINITNTATTSSLSTSSPSSNNSNCATAPSTSSSSLLLSSSAASSSSAAASTSNSTCATSSTTAAETTSNQFVTPQKPENKSIQLHTSSTSLKKKRNKFSKCLANNMHDVASISNIGGNMGDAGVHYHHHHHDSSSSSLSHVIASNIKTSLSMTSLPPDEKQESRDGIKAKLKVERPYNSLKKNADRNLTNQLGNMHTTKTHANNGNKHNRYSWGSGHSSSSLHSSAATLGIGSGKDDLWAAIQTNYNYIMDTNLLDTCKEARCEIEGAASVLDNTLDKSFKMLDENNRNVGSCEDPKELRKWLRDMEHKLENAPTLSEATMLTCAELESHLNEHSVLYHEIVSHARIVSACIRAASEKEQLQQQQLQQQQQQLQQQQQQHDSYNTDASLIAEQTNSSLSSTDDTTTLNSLPTTLSSSSGIVCSTESKLPSPSAAASLSSSSINDNQISPSAATAPSSSGPTKSKSENNLERLQNRYHLLYLKAFEVQLWLDGLLRKRSSSVGNLTNEDLDSEDIDDSIDYSDDCLDGPNHHNEDDVDDDNNDDGATEDDLNDVASDLESDITHNSLSYNDDLQQQHQQHLYNKNHRQQRLQRHSSDIDENQTINVSSHHHQQQHLQTSRDCIQTKIDCEDGDDEEEEDYDDEDEIDSPKHKKQLGYTKLLVTFDRSSGRSSSSAAGQHKTFLTLTDFEADSESSDLETIQQQIRNQRKGHYLLQHQQQQSYKFLTNNATTIIPKTIKRSKNSATSGTITNAHLVGFQATVENTRELESCELHDMQTTAATVNATATLLNAMVNDHLQQKHQQQQQQQHSQRVTLMAITQNTMTTGSATTTTTANLSSSAASNGSSSNISVAGGTGSNTSIAGGGVASNNNMPTKLSGNESNQQQHQHHHHHHHHHYNNNNHTPPQQPPSQQQHKVNGGPTMKQKNIAIISPNSHKNLHHHHQQHHHNSSNKYPNHHHHHPHHNHNKSPTVLRKHYEHHHSSDISKFNRSNRKSKNCAIFYFKHLDTDNETNYSNSNCGDDVVGGGVVGGNVGGVGNDNIVGGLLSSSAASSHTSDLLKSADVSSDDEDEGWMYTSSPVTVATNQQLQQQQQPSIGGTESLNSNHISRGIASNEIHILDGGIQSSTVSSSTTTSATLAQSTAEAAAIVVSAATVAAIIGDDSDKENKEAKAAATAGCSTSLTKIHLTTNQTFVGHTTTVIDTTEASTQSNTGPSGGSSSSSITSSSYSSNDMLTEATTTSTKTNATQILKYPQQHYSKQHPQYHSEMELPIKNNSSNNNNHHRQLIENSLSSSSSAAIGPTTTMPHIVINNNNNCANSPPPSSHRSLSSAAASATNSPPQSQKIIKHNCGTASSPKNSSYSDDTNGNLEKENIRFYTRADICNISVKPLTNDNNHHHQQHQQQIQNINVISSSSSNSPPATSQMYNQQLLHVNVGKRLPPRSPAKSSLSHTSTNTSTSTISPTKGKVSHESIKQLVLEAEHLVRDEALKTPTKQKHSTSGSNNNNNNGGGVNIVQISTTVKKREVIMPGPIKRVQEWLEHQPSTPVQLQKSSTTHGSHHDHSISPNSTAPSPTRTDDCEASGEASETDSIPQHCSDTSEVSDSIATCMQTSTNSYGNSTERIGGSAEPIVNAATSNQSLNVKVVKRQQTRRKSERPWSVSCLSQLTTDAHQVASKVNTITNVQSGLASHSISESALDSLSPGRPRTSSSATQVKGYDSKGSLKRRKTRKKKLSYTNGKKSDTNSEDNHHHNHTTTHQEVNVTKHHHHLQQQQQHHQQHPQTLIMQSFENMTPQQIQEITQALIQLQNSGSNEQLQLANNILQQHHHLTAAAGMVGGTNESEEENHLMKPNFRVGSFTTAYMTNEARLGSLAALATYMNEDEQQQGEYTTGTEDHHSSFSETAWDNYQEKYNSENYSEGFDSDAARKLLEFGDDYRNFIDSQSDCCSSLSAANNIDSFSPPRMDSLQQNESKIITQDTIVSSVDHARRRRALELEYERRRKNLEIRRKSCQESLEYHNPKSPAVTLSSSTQALTPKNSERFNFQQHKVEAATRKLEFGMSHSAQSLRRTSESDTSQRRRKADERRRSSRNLEKCIKLIPATSSSSGDDTDDEKEIRNLLQQSHNRLEDTRALKIRCHLLRPEDYTEIINTCRDNIRCLESVLKGPSSSVLSSQCVTQSKDLLAAWEDLLGWSENAAAARKMQEDMIVLKHSLNRLGNKSSFELLDTEPSIQIAIEALKNEKTQLQTYRTSMLKLNASVHSWLTRQERRLQNALLEQQLKEAAAKVSNELLEEKDELESEQKEAIVQQQLQEQTVDTTSITTTTKSTSTTATTMITVTDSNGNQVESHITTTTAPVVNTVVVGTTSCSAGVQTTAASSHSTTASCSSSGSGGSSEKSWDLQSLITSETEFHKHLKDEVSDMYTAWDEADARINTQLENLTSSLIAWRQLECGLSEFQLALGQDRGTLKGLEGALNTGQATPGELAQNVKLVAKLLSEKVNVSQEQLTAVQDYLDPNHILHIAKFTASNGSLSDSGISDGGTTSDGGLSERERRLGVLRRLAKQLESALAPGSEAMKSIAARMESAEIELKSLQNTCRDLIVRTAASHQNKKQQLQEALEKREEVDTKSGLTNGNLKMALETNGKSGNQGIQQHNNNATNGTNSSSASSNSKRNKRKPRRNSNTNCVASADLAQSNAVQMLTTAAGDGDDDPSDDPSLSYDLDSSDDELTPKSKRGWAWRIARVAVPMQLALFTVFCAACMMQPNCCDNINNLSMSFTPQLRYIRGPPPI